MTLPFTWFWVRFIAFEKERVAGSDGTREKNISDNMEIMMFEIKMTSTHSAPHTQIFN